MVTITTVGYGDIVPITPLERIITILVIIIGSGIFAVYSSALANLFSDLVKKDIIQKGKLENFEKCGEIYNFSRELKDNYIALIEKGRSGLDQIHDYKIDKIIDFFLPTNLRLELIHFLYKDAISIVPIFQNREARFYLDFLVKFKPQFYRKGSYIV